MMQQFCTFYLDELCFGVEVLKVQEVLKAPAMTRVPLAPPAVCGLLNLRGQIVTALDLRRCLDLGERERPAQLMSVIVNVGDAAVSLLVDRMGDVLELAETQFEPPPQTLARRIRRLVTGVYKLDKGLLLQLDLDKTTDLENLKGA